MTYDLKTWKAPRASGMTLRMLAALVGHPPLGGLLGKQLLASVGIKAFRQNPASGPIPCLPPTIPLGTTGPDRRMELLESLPAGEPAEASGFRFESAADFVAAYREGKTTPEEVAARIVAAVEASDALDPPMRTFVAQNKDDLFTQARAATERYRQGRPLGALDGVPVAVKDELDLKGYPTRVGTRFLGDSEAKEDAEVVARMRTAGALLLGKTNMTEIGIEVTGMNPHNGPARNPYDPLRGTGGSSSGPAAAVAAGFCPVALGADGGGSIRMPAALCGVVGLKPTFGRVSEHGAAPLCWSVAHIGPIAATARDAAAAYALMAGPDPKDPNTRIQPEPRLTDFRNPNLKGLTLGIYPAYFEDAEAQVVTRCRELLDGLKDAGAEVVEIELPDLTLLRTVHTVIIVSEMAASHLDYFKQHRKKYAHDTRLNLELANRLKATDYVHALRHRQRLCSEFAGILEKVDGIVTPSTGCTAQLYNRSALKTGESYLERTDTIMRFARPANLTGLPAISMPAGYDDRELPVGLQVMGRAWEEHKLLRIARISEGLVTRRKPKVTNRLLGEQS
jgi:Asp-tRNA(Asn)/Glu-tRNA(Gln) amidotransferase A subunit family amidase